MKHIEEKQPDSLMKYSLEFLSVLISLVKV